VRQTALTALCTATPTALAQLWRLTARQLGVRSRLAGVVYVGLACTLFIASIYLGAVRFLPEFRVNLYMGRLQVLPTAYAVVLDGLEIFPSLVLAQNLLVQPPLLVLYLSTVATLQREHYHTMLKWLVVLAFVGAALVTPPGPMSQLLIALPLSVAYIASCLLGYRLLVLRKRCSG
jgi:sec-independent protein translocase protein TatC